MNENRNFKSKCPGCGKKTFTGVRKKGEKKKSFECPICKTRWSVTFEDSSSDLRRAYELAEDI